MSHQSIVIMAGSESLRARLIASAASQGVEDPVGFVGGSVWQIVASEGWAQAWDDALAQTNQNGNPDTGVRDDVITDDMIDVAVGQRVADLTLPEGSGEQPVGDGGTLGDDG